MTPCFPVKGLGKQIETSEDAGLVGPLVIRYTELKVSGSLPGGDIQQGVGNACLSKAFCRWMVKG